MVGKNVKLNDIIEVSALWSKPSVFQYVCVCVCLCVCVYVCMCMCVCVCVCNILHTLNKY